MLTRYLTATRALLQLPGSSSNSLYTDADLTRYINTSRGQLAGEAECIRVLATISTVAGQQPYNFSALNTGVAATNGVEGVLNVRSIRYNVGDGSLWIPPRNWEWFEFYVLNNVTPVAGIPSAWSQYGQGGAPGDSGATATGSFYINKPDVAYVLNCDCVCYPKALALDADPEAIPYLFTDAVPFFAAYYALLSAQTNARMNDALNYYKMYNEFMQRARRGTNSSPNRWQNSQAQDPAQAAKMGVKAGGVG